MLVRALANISLCYVRGHGVLFTTMERGNNLVPDGPDLAAEVVARLEPLTTSHLVIDNEFLRDLEPELWQGDELTREIAEVGSSRWRSRLRLSVRLMRRSRLPRRRQQSRRRLRASATRSGVGS
jgi:hypothetical protein